MYSWPTALRFACGRHSGDTTDDIVDPIAGTAREYATLRDRCWYASARK
jgi:hypothetical protein